MKPEVRKNLIIAAAVMLAVALIIVFPRITRFAEMAGREFRFFWWLLLPAGVALYLAFRSGGKKR